MSACLRCNGWGVLEHALGEYTCPDCRGGGYEIKQPAAPIRPTCKETVGKREAGETLLEWATKLGLANATVKEIFNRIDSDGDRIAELEREVAQLRQQLAASADKTAATVQPVASVVNAIEQWRRKGTSCWYDVDAEDKEATLGTHTGYEKRTLYAAPQPQAAQSEDSLDAEISDVSDLCRHGELAERIYGLAVRTIGMAIRQTAPDESLLFHIKRLSDHLPTRHRQLLCSHIEWHEAGRLEEPQRNFVQADAALAQAGKEQRK